jgi:hypothetical protein
MEGAKSHLEGGVINELLKSPINKGAPEVEMRARTGTIHLDVGNPLFLGTARIE